MFKAKTSILRAPLTYVMTLMLLHVQISEALLTPRPPGASVQHCGRALQLTFGKPLAPNVNTYCKFQFPRLVFCSRLTECKPVCNPPQRVQTMGACVIDVQTAMAAKSSMTPFRQTVRYIFGLPITRMRWTNCERSRDLRSPKASGVTVTQTKEFTTNRDKGRNSRVKRTVMQESTSIHVTGRQTTISTATGLTVEPAC
ncbi:hypothetical protein PSTT_05105, partial [Puccinia striiformis]